MLEAVPPLVTVNEDPLVTLIFVAVLPTILDPVSAPVPSLITETVLSVVKLKIAPSFNTSSLIVAEPSAEIIPPDSIVVVSEAVPLS